MERVAILGPGGAGKTVLATRLGALLDLPVLELDKHFWSADLAPLPPDQWAARQRRLVAGPRWILDGDLGPYDDPTIRLHAADTVVLLDFPLWRCAWRALRRSRENVAFWRWLLTYRHRSRPAVLAAIASHAGHAQLHQLRNPQAVARFLAQATTSAPPTT